jgi:small subunit ribosomal protein S3
MLKLLLESVKMIERKIIADIVKEHLVENFLRKQLPDVPMKSISLEKSPQGEKIIIETSAPGLVIGKGGENIKNLTINIKDTFNFKNPQIKIDEVEKPHLSAKIVAKLIANDLKRFGSQKFKLTAFKNLTNVMNSGAMGCEIRISGKLPSSRAKSWRFQKGYLKKTGFISDEIIDKAVESANLKTGTIGIKVMIMGADVVLPDKISYIFEEKDVSNDEIKEIKEEIKEENSQKIEIKNKEISDKKTEKLKVDNIEVEK